MRAQVFFWLRDTVTPISLNAGTQAELQVEQPTGTIPNAPNPIVSQITKDSARIAWDPPFDGGSPIVSYHIVIKNETTGQQIYSLSQTSTLYNALLLQPNNNYSVFVLAQNSIGNSPEGLAQWTTLADTTTEPPPDPEPVVNSQYLARIYDSITGENLFWEKVYVIPTNEDSIISSYNNGDQRLVLSFRQDTTAQVNSSANSMITEIEAQLLLVPVTPPEPNQDSYTMELTTASYLPTDQGKTVNIQIQIKLIGVATDSAFARLQIKQKLSGTVIHIEGQPLQIGGAINFPVVFNVPDLQEATALIDWQIILYKSEADFIALTQFPLVGSLEYTAPPTTPPPNQNTPKGSILHKIGGLTALAGTLALLGKRR
jgi:hypothetical protein